MTDFLDRWASASEANARLVAQETLITKVAEALWIALDQANMTKSELATRLGSTKGHVSQVLGGSRNMTLRTLSDICFALDMTPDIRIAPTAEDRVGWFTPQQPAAVVTPRRYLRLIADDGELVPSGEWATAA